MQIGQFLSKKPLIFLVCSLHSLLLVFLTFWWMNTTFMYEDEYLLIRLTSVIKRIAFGIEEKPDKSRFLFVGVCLWATKPLQIEKNWLGF